MSNQLLVSLKQYLGLIRTKLSPLLISVLVHAIRLLVGEQLIEAFLSLITPAIFSSNKLDQGLNPCCFCYLLYRVSKAF